MTIIQLEYLLAVANCGSFSLAAEHCFVTQPSLSMQVKALEEELGVVLLDRSKKPVIPTEAGEVVLDRARETLRAYNNIRESVAELKGETSGKLRLGVIPTIAPYAARKRKEGNLYADLLSGREVAVDKGTGNGPGRLVSHHPEPTGESLPERIFQIHTLESA